MTIRAVIFDLGGVLIEMNWPRYNNAEPVNGKDHAASSYDAEQLNAELAQFVGRLRPRFKTASICNGGSREAVNRKFRLGDLMDLMIFDGEEGVSKPDERIFRLTLQRLEILPQEAVFIDDQQRNIEAAKGIGMHAVHFQNAAQAITEIAALLQN